MALAYTYDPDLEFLQELSDEDLDVLVQILTKDKDGKERYTTELSKTKKFKQLSPDKKHVEYWDLIAAELQTYGGNTIINTLIRSGRGVLYKEILIDVCGTLKLKINKDYETEKIESELISKVFEMSIKEMDEKQLQQFIDEIGIKVNELNPHAINAAVQLLIKSGGLQTYQLLLIAANSVASIILGQGLRFVAGATLTRTISTFAGPIGWAVAGAWTVVDIAGPAYRVTFPAVLQVALLRFKLKNNL